MRTLTNETRAVREQSLAELQKNSLKLEIEGLLSAGAIHQYPDRQQIVCGE